MKPIFADTSYFIALAERRDVFHDAAATFSQMNERPILTSSGVIMELGAHFSPSASRRIFLRILQIIEEDRVEIVFIDPPLQERGITLFSGRGDKNWSLVDCISFIVMQERTLVEAATTDIHFVQAGFIALLRQPAGK